jgi:hypothetical protein
MLLFSALEIFLTWAVIALALIGLGSIVLALFSEDNSLIDSFWMGLGISVAVLEIWSLVLPVTASVALFLFGAGLFGLALTRSKLPAGLLAAWQNSRWLLLLGVAFALLLALRSCGPCEYGDTGLYGAPSVHWIQTYPAVPGLANLHGRLGFNSSVFLCIAALGQGPWKDLGFHLFTGFLLAAFWATLLPACARCVNQAAASPTDWFHCILAVPAFFWTTRSRIVGTQTDEPAEIVALIAAGILFADLSQNHREDRVTPTASRLFLAATLFSLAVTFKESTAVFAFLAWCLVFRRIWQTMQTAASMRSRRLRLAAALVSPAFLLLPWLARSTILSGYPLFPATIFAFHVPWKVPLSAARWYALGVHSWGRGPESHFEDTQGFRWLADWLNHALRNRPSFQVPLAIGLASLAIALAVRFSEREKPLPAYPWLSLLFPGLAGILFWFVASPDPRFAQFSIWTTAATLGAWAITSMDFQRPSSHTRPAHTRIILATLFLSLIWCLISLGWKEPLRALRGVQQPPPLPTPTLILRHTLSGLAVYVPAEGGNCWNAPLPCTPYFDPSLRLRDASSLRWGFTSEGRAVELQTYSW